MPSLPDWPVLKRYDSHHLAKIALPLGGIGTGTVSLGGRGDLRDWEVVNRPAKGFTPDQTFFAVHTQGPDGLSVTRALEGPLDLSLYEGALGSTVKNHGLPRFRECAFEAAYPLGQVELSDLDVPVSVRLQAFNPLVPCDPERSGLPVAVLRYAVTNQTDATLAVSVCGSVQNFVGQDGTHDRATGNHNQFRRRDKLAGLLLRPGVALPPDDETWGTLALATPDGENISYRTAWADLSWGDVLLDFWDDLRADGRLDERAPTAAQAEAGGAAGVDNPMRFGSQDKPTASLCVQKTLTPRETQTFTFLLAWRFPNRQTWSPAPGVSPVIGNFYAAQFRDAWDAAAQVFADLPALEESTVAFVRAFCDSDLPAVVKEAALFNLSTLRSQTCFRTPDGRFYGWEGCDNKSGCCEGSCTHVWNYEQATAFLFGSLSRTMRDVEFLHATRPDGHMSFRVFLPLQQAARHGLAAADGQMGCLMKLYRDWQLCGDADWLRSLWPQAKKALEFCWIPGGWDADADGVMEGCQHNTMDVEYYGPNPQMGTWYLGALRACEEMARFLGDAEFADHCRSLFQRGSRWVDDHLFNGEYYEQMVVPPPEGRIAPGLRHESMGTRDLIQPDLQLGPGCLIDQMVGQYMAHICGLGYLLDRDHIQTTLASIMRYNYRPNLASHFNHLRTFALGDEAALLMATYPRGHRPPRPFPYYNEVMTGFEYTAAVGMLYEGQQEDGLTLIRAIRERYDGLRRSPFDEAECGHHYARAMASWAAVTALTGFHYSAVDGTLTAAASPQPVTWFWSSGVAWGTVQQNPTAQGMEVRLTVLFGALHISRMVLTGLGEVVLPSSVNMMAGQTVSVLIAGRTTAVTTIGPTNQAGTVH